MPSQATHFNSDLNLKEVPPASSYRISSKTYHSLGKNQRTANQGDVISTACGHPKCDPAETCGMNAISRIISCLPQLLAYYQATPRWSLSSLRDRLSRLLAPDSNAFQGPDYTMTRGVPAPESTILIILFDYSAATYHLRSCPRAFNEISANGNDFIQILSLHQRESSSFYIEPVQKLQWRITFSDTVFALRRSNCILRTLGLESRPHYWTFSQAIARLERYMTFLGITAGSDLHFGLECSDLKTDATKGWGLQSAEESALIRLRSIVACADMSADFPELAWLKYDLIGIARHVSLIGNGIIAQIKSETTAWTPQAVETTDLDLQPVHHSTFHTASVPDATPPYPSITMTSADVDNYSPAVWLDPETAFYMPSN